MQRMPTIKNNMYILIDRSGANCWKINKVRNGRVVARILKISKTLLDIL